MSEVKYRQLRRSQADNIPATVKRIFSYLTQFRWQIVLVFVFIAIESLASVASSYFMKPLINDYIAPLIGQENPDLSGFISHLILMACVFLAGVFASWCYRKLMSIISTGTLHNMRTDLFRHMQDMSVSFYDGHTNGELMNYYTSDIDTIRPLIADSMPQLFATTISLTGSIVMMLSLSPKLTVITLTLLVMVLLISIFVGKMSRKYFKRIQKTVSAINGYAEEMFLGQKEVKVFCHEKESVAGFTVFNNATMEASIRSNMFAQSLMPINANLSYIAYAVVAVMGARMCIAKTMDVGSVASFLLYCRQIAGPVSSLSQQFNGMMMSIAGAERVFNVLDTPTELDEGKIELVNVEKDEQGNLTETDVRTEMFAWKDPADGTLTELKGDIRLNNVTFWYERGKVVLQDVSLYAKPGQKIAFVGSTGAGKTTITNLINRFYDVQKGEITYDGIPISRIKKSSLRNSLGVVLQDTNLFSGTVMDNIRYGKLDATDEECIAAAKLANAHSFIKRLPEGYNTMLTANGTNLSQGQRQLLNIARAAVSDPPVLILDEATSSIDTHTERVIEKGMDKLMQGRTVFVIAHRLSTVRNSNAIIVLEHGRIIERGDHEALLQNKGRYYQLYTGKAELD
ncbi:MAG: ABC transporter ATP-binding protein [Erysipelotrichaceae bacterium]|nr:ABC transporter ATP-binding protein [Erysipelotrichaceae bacterium]